MSLPLYHEDLVEFFQRSNQPFIFPYKEKGDICLGTFEPTLGNETESIRAIKGVTNALVHLKLNLIMPCQIKFDYVVRKKGQWGLKHAICERSSEVEVGEDIYNPEQFLYHQSHENELIWNVGKVWLRFFTPTPITIKHQDQKMINKIVDENVPVKQINCLIKKLLTWKPKDRINFEAFLSEDLFISEEAEQTISFYTSFIGHMKVCSTISMDKSMARQDQLDLNNPFVKQIRYRCFLEYLDVDFYFQHLKNQLLREYNTGSDKQKAMCQFTRYMMSLQNYFNLVRINSERLQIGERFEELEHRLYYTRFAKRMVTIRDDTQKKARKLRNNQYLTQNYRVYLRPLEELNQNDVYNKFKTCLSQYAQYLNEDLRKDDNDIAALRLLVKIYIIRTSTYLFNELRTQVFEPFLRVEKRFNLKRVCARINECNERKTLKQLLVNIKHFYFS